MWATIIDSWNQLAPWQQISLLFLASLLLGLCVTIDARRKPPGIYLIRRRPRNEERP
jgi:hypothetical protein